MDRRTLLKIMGGIAALPALGKAIKGTGIKAIKAAGKVLPKVSGMPEWFNPLVSKIMKEGKDISPQVKNVEDIRTIKTVKDGDTNITIEQNKIEGTLDLHIESPRNPNGEPVTLRYKEPKLDIDEITGKQIKEPGKFQVIESEPQWVGRSEDPSLELGEKVTTIDQAAGDIEAAERYATGKIKDRNKIKERRSKKDYMENSPGDYLESEYGPGPDYKNYDIPDYADGGIASFANAGIVKAKKKSKAEEPLSKYKSYSEQELLENIEAKNPNQLQSFSLEDYQLNTMPMFEPKDVAPPKSYSPMPVEKYLRGREYMDLANGGVANMFRKRPEYSLGGPTKAIRKISPETPMEEPLPSGLAIKSIRPTQQAIDDFVNMPVAMGQMIGPDALPNEDYVTYVRRKRAETGPPLFEAIRDPNVIPLNAPGVFPRLETTPQVDVSANPIARSLEMAGFTKEEIMRILGQQGFADGGRVSMSDGGLTTTIAPAKGPDSQGVESLFRRRYN